MLKSNDPRIVAAMDRWNALLRDDNGPKFSFSGHEMVILCNLAKLGVHALALSRSDDEESQALNERQFREHAERLNRGLATSECSGIDCAGMAGTSLLHSEKILRFIVSNEDAVRAMISARGKKGGAE